MTGSVHLRKTTTLAMIAAFAYATVLVFKLVCPIQIAGFLSLEPKDSLLAIAAFLYGPLAGLTVSVVVSAVECLTVSSTGIIGFLMNVLSSVLFICPAAALYRRRPGTRTMLLGLCGSALFMSAGMLLWNYLITPLYLPVDRAAVAGMLLPTILPFNLLKAGINAALLLLMYGPLTSALRKARLLPEEETSSSGQHITRYWWLALILIPLVLVALVWSGLL